jgi:hypothetical protein
MVMKHSKDEARVAKQLAVSELAGNSDITSVGIGMTEDKSDYAVTITAKTLNALKFIPARFGSVPVRKLVTGGFTALKD